MLAARRTGPAWLRNNLWASAARPSPRPVQRLPCGFLCGGTTARAAEPLRRAEGQAGRPRARTTKRGELESKDELKRRIDAAARFTDIDQLCLSPQCGFSSTKEGNHITPDQQWAKLALIVETAQEVWGSL